MRDKDEKQMRVEQKFRRVASLNETEPSPAGVLPLQHLTQVGGVA